MKILERHDPYEDWKLEIVCEDINESCGSKLEINKDDILFRTVPRFLNTEQKIYGVICPVCGAFIQINKKLIPDKIRNIAKSYDLTRVQSTTEFVRQAEKNGKHITAEAVAEAELEADNIRIKAKDIGKNPCILNGCSASKRQSCCGCVERIEWERKRKNANNNKNGTN